MTLRNILRTNRLQSNADIVPDMKFKCSNVSNGNSLDNKEITSRAGSEFRMKLKEINKENEMSLFPVNKSFIHDLIN